MFAKQYLKVSLIALGALLWHMVVTIVEQVEKDNAMDRSDVCEQAAKDAKVNMILMTKTKTKKDRDKDKNRKKQR